jgi:hypothetical protein
MYGHRKIELLSVEFRDSTNEAYKGSMDATLDARYL